MYCICFVQKLDYISAWRQSLNEPLINVLHHRSTILTLSGDTRVILRCWDIETGFLKWEVPTLFDVPVKIFSLSARWRPGGLLMATGGSKNGLSINYV